MELFPERSKKFRGRPPRVSCDPPGPGEGGHPWYNRIAAPAQPAGRRRQTRAQAGRQAADTRTHQMVVVKLQFVNQTDVCFKIENRRDSSAWMRGRQDRACPWGHGAGDRCVCARQTTVLELHPPQADGAGDIAEGIAIGVLAVPVVLYALGYALGASVVTEKTFDDAIDDVCAPVDIAIGKVKKKPRKTLPRRGFKAP